MAEVNENLYHTDYNMQCTIRTFLVLISNIEVRGRLYETPKKLKLYVLGRFFMVKFDN